MGKIEWFPVKKYGESIDGTSRFVDSKFALAKGTSVVRELTQNSIDAKDDEEYPDKSVEIEIDVKGIDRDKIPGIDELVKRINACLEYANIDAKYEYEHALKLLAKDKIYCLKVSDRYTTGLSADEDEKGDSAFRALIYNEGDSYGKGTGAAGSHGVGKRAAFILSACNTVFYATKYKNANKEDVCLFEGKHMLSDWNDGGQLMHGDGWFGIVEGEKVRPVRDAEKYGVDEYFLRTDDYGTDVIALCIDYENNEEAYKKLYINDVLENFYVGIIDGKITLKVFGEVINSETINDVFKKYYDEERAPYLSGTNKSLLSGNLYDYKRVYVDVKPEEFDIVVKGEKFGNIKIYYDDSNRKKKKYYSIVRGHGMKIKDFKMSTEKEFTAVVKIEGDILNAKLLLIENAAHDDFLKKDLETHIEYPEDSLAALNEITDIVDKYIKERTKIEAEETQKIDGLSSVLSLPGKVSNVRQVDKEVKPVYPKPPKIPQVPSVKNKLPFKDYNLWPRCIEGKNCLKVVFDCNRDVKKGCMSFYAVDFEGKETKGMDTYFGTVIAYMDGQIMKKDNNNNYVFEKIKKGKHIIELRTTDLLPYRYTLHIYENNI